MTSNHSEAVHERERERERERCATKKVDYAFVRTRERCRRVACAFSAFSAFSRRYVTSFFFHTRLYNAEILFLRLLAVSLSVVGSSSCACHCAIVIFDYSSYFLASVLVLPLLLFFFKFKVFCELAKEASFGILLIAFDRLDTVDGFCATGAIYF